MLLLMEAGKKQKEEKIEDDIFLKIPKPIWSELFGILNEDRDSQRGTFKNLRLTCKTFRELLSPLWTQFVPFYDSISYFEKLKQTKLEESISSLSIGKKNFDEFVSLFRLFPPNITSLKLKEKNRVSILFTTDPSNDHISGYFNME